MHACSGFLRNSSALNDYFKLETCCFGLVALAIQRIMHVFTYYSSCAEEIAIKETLHVTTSIGMIELLFSHNLSTNDYLKLVNLLYRASRTCSLEEHACFHIL